MYIYIYVHNYVLTSGKVCDTCTEPLVSMRTLRWPAALAVLVSLLFTLPPFSARCISDFPGRA